MIINAYDSLPGKVYKVTEKAEQTIKTLELTHRLVNTTMKGVYAVDHTSPLIPPFSYPITMKSHSGEWITVFDKRPFLNKSGKVTNLPELNLFKLTAFLQQQSQLGVKNVLQSGRKLTVKGFVSGLSGVLAHRTGLGFEEQLHLKVLLTHYYVCISEPKHTNHLFITTNVLREVFRLKDSSIYLEEVEYMDGLENLLKAIHNHPVLYKLKTMDLKDFLTLVSRLTFTSSGSHVVTASAECPCLLTAIVYTVATNNLYNKTVIGNNLDKKHDSKLIEEFDKVVNYAFDMRE